MRAAAGLLCALLSTSVFALDGPVYVGPLLQNGRPNKTDTPRSTRTPTPTRTFPVTPTATPTGSATGGPCACATCPPTITPTPAPCTCDRNGDHQVSVDEVLSGVHATLYGCP